MRIDRRSFTLLGISLLATVHVAAAQGLKNPVESPILVVAGKITATNKGQRAWYNGEVRFEGVAFSRLMTEIGATGENLVITALDDYSREIPIEDLVRNKATLAMKRDGLLFGPFAESLPSYANVDTVG